MLGKAQHQHVSVSRFCYQFHFGSLINSIMGAGMERVFINNKILTCLICNPEQTGWHIARAAIWTFGTESGQHNLERFGVKIIRCFVEIDWKFANNAINISVFHKLCWKSPNIVNNNFLFAITPIFILLLYKRCITEIGLQKLMIRFLLTLWSRGN